MGLSEHIQPPQVAEKFASYPEHVRVKMNYLRELLLSVASEVEGISKLEESLKWREPSYKVKQGSPIRMDWKAKAPDQYALYFNCNTSLVETFRIVYGDLFRYEKNRAIVFSLEETLPEKELKECIRIGLTYQLLKDKPLLGM